MALATLPASMTEYLLDITIRHLLETSDSITTLDIKNEFRNQYKNVYIDQATVSTYMADSYKNYALDYNDNGTFRTYYKANDDTNYYNSNSKGRVKISDMQYNHLENALVKSISDYTNLSKSTCKDLVRELVYGESVLHNLFEEYYTRDEY